MLHRPLKNRVITTEFHPRWAGRKSRVLKADASHRVDLGITDTTQLYKVITGFNSNVTYYGTEIYTIRGVGFQDTALASGPTVSVYMDQAPLQFAALTQGVMLDLNHRFHLGATH